MENSVNVAPIPAENFGDYQTGRISRRPTATRMIWGDLSIPIHDDDAIGTAPENQCEPALTVLVLR